MTQPDRVPPQRLLPCPFCGSDNIQLWGGFGTQADIECSECCCGRYVQVVDLVEDGEERPSFDEKTCKYPDWLIERANKHLTEEWNTRSRSPAESGNALPNVAIEALREAVMIDALREAERFMAYFSFETGGHFVGPGTPQQCLAQIREALGVHPKTITYRSAFEVVIESLNYDGEATDSLTVGEIRRSLGPLSPAGDAGQVGWMGGEFDR
jgi:hypothetical protein